MIYVRVENDDLFGSITGTDSMDTTPTGTTDFKTSPDGLAVPILIATAS
jgi:hypothetical protein